MTTTWIRPKLRDEQLPGLPGQPPLRYIDERGCSYTSLTEFVSDRLGICGCCEEAMDFVRVLLEAAGSEIEFDGLVHWWAVEKMVGIIYGHTEKLEPCTDSLLVSVLSLAMSALDNAGLVEHGGNIRGSWLTDDGRLVLDMLREEEP